MIPANRNRRRREEESFCDSDPSTGITGVVGRPGALVASVLSLLRVFAWACGESAAVTDSLAAAGRVL